MSFNNLTYRNPFEESYPNYPNNSNKSNYSNKTFQTLEDINKIDEKIKNENIELLKNDILHLAKQINDTAKETKQELNEQGEILSEVQPELEEINKNLAKSKTLLSIIKNKFNKFAFWTYLKSNVSTSDNIKIDKTNVENIQITPEDDFNDCLIKQLKSIKKINEDMADELDSQNKHIEHMIDLTNKNTNDIKGLNKDIYQLLR